MVDATCNICGGSEWRDVRLKGSDRGDNGLCLGCHSKERSRVIKLFLDKLALPRPGMKILHFAPEKGLALYFLDMAPEGYDPVDLDYQRFDFCEVRPFNLVTDVESLPSEEYDIILHSHVMEHIPANDTAIFFHLHRALKKTGYHIFSLPIRKGRWREDFHPMSKDERVAAFGQSDHVRSYGRDDIMQTLGMIFDIPQHYSLYDHFTSEELGACNIGERYRVGYTGSSVFVQRKDSLKLVL